MMGTLPGAKVILDLLHLISGSRASGMKTDDFNFWKGIVRIDKVRECCVVPVPLGARSTHRVRTVRIELFATLKLTATI